MLSWTWAFPFSTETALLLPYVPSSIITKVCIELVRLAVVILIYYFSLLVSLTVMSLRQLKIKPNVLFIKISVHSLVKNHLEYDDYLKLSWEIRFYLIKIISYKNIAELFLYQMVTTRFKWLIAKL